MAAASPSSSSGRHSAAVPSVLADRMSGPAAAQSLLDEEDLPPTAAAGAAYAPGCAITRTANFECAAGALATQRSVGIGSALPAAVPLWLPPALADAASALPLTAHRVTEPSMWPAAIKKLFELSRDGHASLKVMIGDNAAADARGIKLDGAAPSAKRAA